MTLDEAVKMASEKYPNRWFGWYYEDEYRFALGYLNMPGYQMSVGGDPTVYIDKKTGEISDRGVLPYMPWDSRKYEKVIPGKEEKLAEIEKMREAELNDTDD